MSLITFGPTWPRLLFLSGLAATGIIFCRAQALDPVPPPPPPPRPQPSAIPVPPPLVTPELQPSVPSFPPIPPRPVPRRTSPFRYPTNNIVQYSATNLGGAQITPRQFPGTSIPGAQGRTTPSFLPAAVPAPRLNFPQQQYGTNNPLAWDALSKEVYTKAGEMTVNLSYAVTNVSKEEVIITAVRPSCGCTIAKVPPLPWKLEPGANDQVELTVDLRGKRGDLHKMVSLDTSAGMRLLSFTVHIPESPADNRSRNMMAAMANRQAVFKNDCANCHVLPAEGKKGEELFAAACGICHEAEHRATMVADLRSIKGPVSREYWHLWVTKGKPGTLMPAFAKSEGGPLDDAQVQSLVDYLNHHFPARRAVQAVTPYHDD